MHWKYSTQTVCWALWKTVWLSLNWQSYAGIPKQFSFPLHTHFEDYWCEERFVCSSYSSVMAHTQVLTHVQFPKGDYSTGRKDALPWRKTRDKVLFKSSCLRAKVFHRLSKKRTKMKEHDLHIFLIRFIIVQKQKYLSLWRHHHTKNNWRTT